MKLNAKDLEALKGPIAVLVILAAGKGQKAAMAIAVQNMANAIKKTFHLPQDLLKSNKIQINP